MFGNEPSNSPTTGATGSRTLDSPPPMPPRQRRSPSVLFTPPIDDSGGMGEMAADPMVQDTMAMAALDKSFQTLARNHPEAIDALAQLQTSARQLYAGLLQMQAQGGMAGMGMGGMGGGMGAPNIVPPLPMQGGATAGQQQGPAV